jgi:hypothetical protein
MMSLQAQVSTFDDLNLPKVDTFWNGSDESGGFTNEGAYFNNSYNSAWNSWSGIAYSNMTDVTTVGSSNQYSAYTGSGYQNSESYAVFYPASKVDVTGGFSKKAMGMYVTNSTYAALSMLNGDQFAKQFGGANGTDADWFLLTIEGFGQGASSGTVEFYLADYRFTDDSQDYILDSWAWVDLSSLGSIDSLEFSLTSSDMNGQWINTPGYFCVDNFTLEDLPTAINALDNSSTISFYPNPASEQLFVSTENEVNLSILNTSGVVVKNETLYANDVVDISGLNAGIYIIRMESNGAVFTEKLIKQ